MLIGSPNSLQPLLPEAAHEADCCFPEGPGRLRCLRRRTAGCEYTGHSLDDARKNLTEAVELVREANRVLAQESMQGKDASASR